MIDKSPPSATQEFGANKRHLRVLQDNKIKQNPKITKSFFIFFLDFTKSQKNVQFHKITRSIFFYIKKKLFCDFVKSEKKDFVILFDFVTPGI